MSAQKMFFVLFLSRDRGIREQKLVHHSCLNLAYLARLYLSEWRPSINYLTIVKKFDFDFKATPNPYFFISLQSSYPPSPPSPSYNSYEKSSKIP